MNATQTRKIRQTKRYADPSTQDRKLSDLELEAAERGKDIEKLIRIVKDFRTFLPGQFCDAIGPVLTKYIRRNTTQSTYIKVDKEFDWL